MTDAYTFALTTLATTPTLLAPLVQALPAEVLEAAPAEGAWSPHQVLAHLLYVETAVIGPRVSLMLSESQPVFPAPAPMRPLEPLPATLDAWLAARRTTLAMLRALRPEQLDRTGRHQTLGELSIREHVVEWAFHDFDHLRQIMAGAQTRLYPSMGVFQSMYPRPA